MNWRRQVSSRLSNYAPSTVVRVSSICVDLFQTDAMQYWLITSYLQVLFTTALLTATAHIVSSFCFRTTEISTCLLYHWDLRNLCTKSAVPSLAWIPASACVLNPSNLLWILKAASWLYHKVLRSSLRYPYRVGKILKVLSLLIWLMVAWLLVGDLF